jgi:hypothetical protein
MTKIRIFIITLFLLLIAAFVVWANSYGTVAVGGAAVQIYTPTSAASVIGVVIQNDPGSAVNVVVGSDSSVTANNHGYTLTPGQGVILNGHQNAWYVITAGTAANVNTQLLF